MYRIAVLFSLLVMFSTGAAAGDRETWISSQRGISALGGMNIPNVAITVPSDILTAYLGKVLTFETETLSVVAAPGGILLGEQDLTISANYYADIPSGLSGLPFDIRIYGDVAFGSSFSFDGSVLRFVPFVTAVTVKSVTGPGGPIIVDVTAEVPDWLNALVQSYLEEQGHLRLPAELTATFPLHAAGLYGGTSTVGVDLTSESFSGELWINAAAVLIRPVGLFAIAEAQFGVTWPACKIADVSTSLEGGFARYDDRAPIAELEPFSQAVVFSGVLGSGQPEYTAHWRFNGITISRHPLSLNGNAFDVTFATPPGIHGTYSMVLVASQARGETGEIVECLVGKREINKPFPTPQVPQPVTSAEAHQAFLDFEAAFEGKRSLGDLPVDPVLLASVRKDLLATSVSQTLSALQLWASVDAGAFPPVAIRGIEVEAPPPDAISCTPTRVCEPTRQCDLRDCPLYEDTRNCKRKSLFGSYNDPFCETAKAAANVKRRADQLICKGDAALEKLDCERIKSQEKAICELEKSAEKALCEGMKEAISLLAPDQNLATLNTDFSFTGRVNARLLSLAVDSSLSGFEAEIQFGAALKTVASIEFIPLNLGGHLACFSKWKEKTTLAAFVPNRVFHFNGSMYVDAATKTLNIEVVTPVATVDFLPRPFEALFGQHPHLIAVCPLLFTAGVAEGIYDSLNGNYDATLVAGHHTIESTAVSVEVTLPGLQIPDYFGMPPLNLAMYSDRHTLTWR